MPLRTEKVAESSHHRGLRSALAAAVRDVAFDYPTVRDELAISIEHASSTAVSGLAAKPVIHIDVLLKSSTDLAVVIRKLADLGYQHQGDLGVSGREAVRANGVDVQDHLYVCALGSVEYDRHIAFRNYLRAHAADANAYALLKRAAYQQIW
jgi:GrpB-like predicted nucleotidyltransferase (UPF0157 family)